MNDPRAEALQESRTFENLREAFASDAQAAAYINLRVPDAEGADIWGVGIDTSITMAPIKAVVSAINRF